jgi:uncharacterized protein
LSLLESGYAFTLHQTPVVALPHGLLWLPRSRTLVGSDLHFEKGSAFAEKGALLPPFDTAETIARLSRVIAMLVPQTLIALGDSFHDVRADQRIDDRDRHKLLELSHATPTVWIEGNHDPEVPSWLLGKRTANFDYDGLNFTHEPTGSVAGEVAGHLHPCARIVGSSGRSIRRRCFISDGRTLIMPAFGAFTGGLNVRDVAFDGLFHNPAIALVMGGTPVKPTKISAIPLQRLERGK